jgi:hypothetical protein
VQVPVRLSGNAFGATRRRLNFLRLYRHPGVGIRRAGTLFINGYVHFALPSVLINFALMP